MIPPPKSFSRALLLLSTVYGVYHKVMADKSYIMLPRDIRKWRWYHDRNTFKVFLHLVLSANYTDCDFENTTIHWGQIATSYESLSRDTGMSVQNVRTAIKHLKSTGDITVNKNPKFSIITINSFESFQRPTSTLTGCQQGANRELTSDQHQYNKGRKEEYKNTSIPRLTSSLPEVSKGEKSTDDIWASSRAMLRGGK